MRGKTYYNILGIARTATISDIKIAYRRLALRYHPDRTKNEPTAAEKFKEINQAYEVLSQGSQRKEYDRRYYYEKNEYDYETADESSEEFQCRNPYEPPSYYNDYYYYYQYPFSSSTSGTSSSSSSQKSSSKKDKKPRARQTSNRRSNNNNNTQDPFTFRWNTSFVVYIAANSTADSVGFGWTIYECDSNGNPTSSNPIHEGMGSFTRANSADQKEQEEATASYRALIDALEYFHKYLSCENYYIKGDSLLAINKIKNSMKDWDGLPPTNDDDDDNNSNTATAEYYHQRSIRLLKRISSAWRRFEYVNKRSQNKRAVQNATNALSSK